ncbi:MAG TPA: hypothetical protein VJ741_23310 [Solirubrobacteraceae bacterium]|nr:hypothetical protein [Solirubrobacteraceae bacterium]
MTNRTATTAAIILSLAAAGAPAASARPVDFVPASQHSPAAVYSRPEKSLIPQGRSAVTGQDGQRVAGLAAYREGQLAASLDVTSPATENASARVHASENGFDWGDAGLGAAAALTLSVMAVGGAFAVSGRRSRRSTAVPS